MSPEEYEQLYPPVLKSLLFTPQDYSKPMQRQQTTLRRQVKTIKLAKSGNFQVKQRVADRVLDGALYVKGQEFESLRYTAVTCDPDMFIEKGYDLRLSRFKRQIEIFVVVTMYNEDEHLFLRTFFALAMNIKYLCKKNKYGWESDGWKKVCICIVSDGRAKIDPNVLTCLEVMGVYQEGLAQSAVNGQNTHAHVYEYTVQNVLDEKFKNWGAKHGIPPIQVVFCLKEKNQKKINSHRWFFNAFCPLVDPRVCVLIDVGTRPDQKSLYRLWKTFYRNEQIAGACGEIRADLGHGIDYFKHILNPLVASQNFEYKISNLLDKALESTFGYISVLPGAFSAYRFAALQDIGPGVGPLAKYFEGEIREGESRDNSLFSANLYLAEDRILCFELISKPDARWTLHYCSKAFADTDVPDAVPEFLSQRRRWLNGSLFAGLYALSNVGKIWRTQHRFPRKIAFTLQFLYNLINQIFSWFIIGNFAVTFHYLMEEVSALLDSGSSASIQDKIARVIVQIAGYSYPVVLVALFIISFGNRPQAFKRTYTLVMFGFGLIGAGMIWVLLKRMLVISNAFLSTNDAHALSNLIQAQANVTTDDSAQLLINTLLLQTSSVMEKTMVAAQANNQMEAILFLTAAVSTIGVYFLASLIQMDITHMFTYLLLLPSYINVLTVYSLANLHDVSWGTKGSTTASALPSVSAQITPQGNVVADVQVVASRGDLDLHHQEALEILQSLAGTKRQVQEAPKLQQEDEYKSFRTNLLLAYLASNALLYILATQLTSNGALTYILVLLGAVSVLTGIKLLGVILFVVLQLITTSCTGFDNRGKWKKNPDQWQPKQRIRDDYEEDPLIDDDRSQISEVMTLMTADN
ncbi:glycosyltransferase family 2 protein [Gorgonomyces haynaldii]|nr:glycosyltransferase family 2 protein [Gorgonomyces haynaldii]